MSVATMATFGVRSGSVAFGATERKTCKSLDLPNWSERARMDAVTLQAGSHRFDPDTLHSINGQANPLYEWVSTSQSAYPCFRLTRQFACWSPLQRQLERLRPSIDKAR